jgi:putative RNA 2'-phosphotransferase
MKKYSKLLSYTLRHAPEDLGLVMDAHGWVEVSQLVSAVQQRYPEFTLALLEEAVRTNEKRRFEFNETKDKIRACQGHSVKVDLKLPEMVPPYFLYHGTTCESWKLIRESGRIEKRSRHAVHLSESTEVACEVGNRRHGKTIILVIRAKLMYDEGFVFSRSTNGVWLTDEVPTKYVLFRDC